MKQLLPFLALFLICGLAAIAAAYFARSNPLVLGAIAGVGALVASVIFNYLRRKK